ncbi:heme-binding domain-containing protein [Maribacter polysaccharolyticus]|uniref:heme-binding domain-containing protein n=1 Tax=Maribacter polysaccharolyticus TaxID=3020831 RepID=UPI00237FA8A0|nr:heme-binding domain-containing protein [Maribacter polysaccharolyticus]MDE3741065.1 heme-binding domain-containing protein [Maribacter polysaccharolyticus]
MKIAKVIGWVLLIVLVGIQFVSTTRNQSDIVPTTDFMIVNNVPKPVENSLITSCYDCHSNNTNYPWYNKVQPVAWFLEGHVEDGKKELNFNEWGNYSSRRRNSKLKSIISQIEDDEMPLTSYTLIHSDAQLSEKNKEIVIKWITQLKDSL